MGEVAKKLIIAGGGTGGHILPGIAVADAWIKNRGDGAKVKFVGARGALEERLVPKHGYPLHRLWIGGLNRVGMLRKLVTLIQLPLAAVHSAFLLVVERPDWVLGVGGYSSGPFVMVASTFGKILGIRTALLEPNSVPGFTNRKLGGRVDRVFVSFKRAREYFPQDQTTLVGSPIRNQMRALPSAPRSPFTIFVFGGSQGAVGMNTMVLEALPLLAGESGIEWIHQAGRIDLDRVRDAHHRAETRARVEVFIDDMVSCYQRASLVICRSGASTLAEISAVRRAAILVPLPTSADNHQVENAKECAATGGAIVVEQGPGGGKALADLILGFKKDPQRLQAMETAISGYWKPGGAEIIVDSMR
jgi:UDP-N-acetylglucosamine--N-acetylmuramyl-(pentapeptide) pyrophosphoryl-undecaprenol N-acetylglucosamine transferase